ncbi:hypothetical protein BH10BDE1_BH10BDE1_21730 [soil metagenome]
MDRFLQLGTLAIAMTFTLSLAPTAYGDGRIAAGAVIPLDSAKASDPEVIKNIITSCMNEEAMKGMFPELSSIESNSGTTKTMVDRSSTDDQSATSGTTTTTTSLWEPSVETALTFNETLADGSTTQRSLDLSLSLQYGEFVSEIQTDYKDLDLSVYLTLPLLPAQLQVVSEGGKSCSMNNWGRNRCIETPITVTAVNLVIPADFVAEANWLNSDSDVETQKRFSYFDYADCILWKWEH